MKNFECIWDAKAELGEGPLWHEEDNALYWVDIKNSNLHRFRFDRDGNEYKHSWHFPGSISSVVVAKKGGLLATFKNGVFHINLNNGKLTQIREIEDHLESNRFNDGSCDSQGNYWFGSMDENQSADTGSFYRLKNNGQLQQMTQMGNCSITNGPTFSQNGEFIYFTNTLEKTIYRANLSENCDISTPQVHIKFGDDDGHPDGMCTDSEGFLWVCHYGIGRVSRFNFQGELVKEIYLPVPNVTKCTFGGTNFKTLFITTAINGMSAEAQLQFPLSGGLFSIDVEQQGFAYPATAIHC
ncbi:SMP-30/gluconolactonase/LRE family protein [Thalassotalea fonticola]|uniref:SMP-30/gluconolactonase/LRE family protein n=1 Tax=Thalassotalea fonticola TaxID=3065649 RepID=A0ABZ0GK33_9GAMM|nr:SMP-30/gluconolactonase/LRE family protein [Colwelliaceae bacterium S1-1]